MTLVLPFVNRGSGSFLKKDFNKLLMTLRSRHFCRVDQGSFRLMQFLQYESITVQRCCQGSGALYCATWLSVTHVFLDVDVIHAFAVELLLHAGDGSVVPRDPVDSCVLQTSLLHNLAAHLHDERNILHKLHKKKKKKINIVNHIDQSHHTLLAPVNEWFKVDVKMHFICLEETHFIFIWMIMSPSLKKQNKKNLWKHSRPTSLLCADGQSSSRTPKVMPAGVFFSNGFLMIPGMAIFQVPLSRGGLDSSDGSNVYKLRLHAL